MANKTEQGYMTRVESSDRISYLHTPSRYTDKLLNGLEISEDGPAAHVTVFKSGDQMVQLCLMHGGFSVAVHITPTQARAIASALFEAAADTERLTTAEMEAA